MIVLVFVFMMVVVVMIVLVFVFMMVVVVMVLLVVVFMTVVVLNDVGGCGFFSLFHTFTKVQFILSNAVI